MASPAEGLLADLVETNRAILEEAREHTRALRALEGLLVVATTSSSSLGGGSRPTTYYGPAAPVTAPGPQAPGVVTGRGRRATREVREALAAEYEAAPKRYPKPSPEAVSRLDDLHAELTGRRVPESARHYLEAALQVHGGARAAEVLRGWHAVYGATDLLLYVRTPRDPREGAAPAEPEYPEVDEDPLEEARSWTAEDFSAIPLDPLPYRSARPVDPREG